MTFAEIGFYSGLAASDWSWGGVFLDVDLDGFEDLLVPNGQQRNLAHASRLAVVGELTAMVAHEINQPLGAILSNADAAEMLDISLLLGPVKTQYTRAADQAVEVRAIQCEIDTKALVTHSISFYVLKISRGIW